MGTRSTSIVVGLLFAVLVALALLASVSTAAVAQCLPGGCGTGMICVNCGRGSMCAIPPATCCAGVICGDGMICVQTSQGPQCGIRPGTALPSGGGRRPPVAPAAPVTPPQPPQGGGGWTVAPFASTWAESELGWSGTWTRRPGTDVFDARWVHPNGHREAAELFISVNGSQVSILRRQQKGECRYEGTLSPDRRSMQGTYGCDWAAGPFQWSATASDPAAGAPAARQPATRGPTGSCPPGTVDLLGVCSGGVQRLQ
jgi:hypothetical protein